MQAMYVLGWRAEDRVSLGGGRGVSLRVWCVREHRVV